MFHPIIGLSPDQPASVAAALAGTEQAQLGAEYANACVIVNQMSAGLMQAFFRGEDDGSEFSQVLEQNPQFMAAKAAKDEIWKKISQLQATELGKLMDP